MKVCFVILHYLADKDTIECVNSIEQLKNADNAEVYIVDNFSDNGSIERVKEAIRIYNNCHIIYNKDNLGFARGNNIGYSTARRENPNSFIVILNNDTIIKQDSFIDKILETYQFSPYHVLGPDIISLVDMGHQNPMKSGFVAQKELTKMIFKSRIWLFLSKIGLYRFVKEKCNAIKRITRMETDKGEYEVLINKALHGSCLIFSKDFVAENDIAFNPGTFLYMEEGILALHCKKQGYKMVYNPSLEIFHKEDSSTDMKVNTRKEKRELKLVNTIKSAKVYREEYK